jgi:exodeoxyribonuclease V alpha subunit
MVMSAETPPNLPLLERLKAQGVLSPLDYHFARQLLGIAGEDSEHVALCAALASRAVQQGHVCVDLARLAQEPPLDDEDEPVAGVSWPSADELRQALRQSRLASDSDSLAPLWLDAHDRLYLKRYALYEAALAQDLLARGGALEPVDLAALAAGVERLFPATGARAAAGVGSADRQRLAACLCVLRRLVVVCGGPGTGKTTTVVKTLCLLQEQRRSLGQRPLDVLLLAPTGKAAQRLAEAVQAGLAALPVDEAIKALVPARASTIHRALGLRNQPSLTPRHHRQNPLGADVVLVDEVSMVDLGLLQRLVDAVRPDARLILQGDQDQLVSVEAGAILGDIYPRQREIVYSRAFAEQLERAAGVSLGETVPEPGLNDCLVTLNESFRYPQDSRLGRLARAINAGDAPGALEILSEPSREHGELADCRLIEPRAAELAERALSPRLAESVVDGYAAYIHARDPEEKLARLSHYRVLCSHRRGPYGVERLNAAVEGWLDAAGLLRPGLGFYEHRPIIVSQNDYQLDLMNGDVGVVVRTADQQLRACFAGANGLRFLLPSRLPPHETVFATTVHKSQGSEFDRVSIVLPGAPSKLLVRELLYTAVTRARRHVELFASAALLASAIERPIERASGLRARLWGAEGVEGSRG